MIVPVWLGHVSDPNKKIMVYALLDEQSDACFVSNSTVSALNIAGQETNLKISTVLAEETVKCQKISGLSVSAINNDDKIPLPKTYTRKTIPVCRDQIPNPETARQWPHLESLTSELMTSESNVEVGLLIGANCPRAIKPREVIPCNDVDPYAIRTPLGWGIIGRVSSNSSGEETPVGVSKIMSRDVQDGCSTRKCCFSFRTRAKEIISPLQVNAMFEKDLNENIANAAPLSHQDRMFTKKLQEGINQRPDGHYEIPLPLKNPAVKLPNNKSQAMSRLSKLQARMKQDEKYKKDYVAFMEEIISKGYAEPVTEEDKHAHDGQLWYLPHHGVYHPQKPGKIRVVFDCSANYHGESQNRHLLSGPNLTNNLLGVLCRSGRSPRPSCATLRRCFTKCLSSQNTKTSCDSCGGRVAT